jgi:hypothetical protein
MANTNSKWISLVRLTFSNSVGDLANAIDTQGIYFKDEYGRAIKAPEEDILGRHKSVNYALDRLRVLHQKQSNPDPIDLDEGEFDRDDEDPLYLLGWNEEDLPSEIKTEIIGSGTIGKPAPSQNKTVLSHFTPRSPSGLAELFKCYDEKQWKRLSKNTTSNDWLKEALAVKGLGRRSNTYYPDIVANGLLSEGIISQEQYNKILLKEAPDFMKDYFRPS